MTKTTFLYHCRPYTLGVAKQSQAINIMIFNSPFFRNLDYILIRIRLWQVVFLRKKKNEIAQIFTCEGNFARIYDIMTNVYVILEGDVHEKAIFGGVTGCDFAFLLCFGDGV